MQRLLTEVEKVEIIECEWAKARAKNPKVVMRVDVQDETDESGKPRVSVVIAFRTWVTRRRGDRMIGRREFITLLGGAAAAWPLAVRAQHGERARRIGVLMNLAVDDAEGQARIAAFLQGLQQLGGTDSGKCGSTTAGQWARRRECGGTGPLIRRRRCQNAVASRIVHAPLTFLAKTDISAMDGIIS
jgi:hypothetical protein